MAEPLLRSDEPSLVIGIGASAGGVEALCTALAGLPGDLDAAVLVVLHVPPSGKSLLAPILDRVTPLRADVAAPGQRVAAGRVYVAPADRHMLVHKRRIVLSRGPKENGTRPAVDPTLRSLAYAYGPRAAAVILSGALGDGSAGAAAIAGVGRSRHGAGSGGGGRAEHAGERTAGRGRTRKGPTGRRDGLGTDRTR